MVLAIGASELTVVLLLLCVIVVPLAAIGFSRSGKGLEQLGKGTFAIDREEPGRQGAGTPPVPAAEHEDEVRQLVEASNFRRQSRGEAELDVEAEIDRLLGRTGESQAPDGEPGDLPEEIDDDGGPGVREEIRQLVIANNERRARRGEDPLDVEVEVDRRMAEWT